MTTDRQLAQALLRLAERDGRSLNEINRQAGSADLLYRIRKGDLPKALNLSSLATVLGVRIVGDTLEWTS